MKGDTMKNNLVVENSEDKQVLNNEEIKEISGVLMDNVVENQLPDYSEMSAEEVAENIRKMQKSLVQKSALGAYKRPGFIRRWVTDVGDAINEYVQKGYAPVRSKDAVVQDGRIQHGTQLGILAKKIVNPRHSSLGTYGILMEIPEEIYKENQIAKTVKNKEIIGKINKDMKDDATKQNVNLSEKYQGLVSKID